MGNMTYRYAGLLIWFSLFLAAPALADCPTTYDNWSTSWQDAGPYTKYKLKAPKKVFIGCPFDVTATVTDSAFPNNWVGGPWSIYDTYSASSGKVTTKIAGSNVGGEGDNIWTSSGVWQRVVTQTYSGIPYDHRIEFSFLDMGDNPYASTSGHRWTGGIIGNTTVDPYPPNGATPPTVVPVMNAWWLLPGVLAGAALLARRKG